MKYTKRYFILYKYKMMEQEFFSGFYDDQEKTIEIAKKLKKTYDEVKVIEDVKMTRTVRAFF